MPLSNNESLIITGYTSRPHCTEHTYNYTLNIRNILCLYSAHCLTAAYTANVITKYYSPLSY